MVMVEHILDRAPTTALLVAALRTAFGTGIPVGLSAIPQTETPAASGNFVVAQVPYLIVYPLWVTLGGPGFGDERHADAEWTYQITHLAVRGDQLEGMRDRTIRTILGKTNGQYARNLDTATVKVTARELKDDTGAGEAAGSALPSDLRFGLYATPA